jgi:glycosyltransferase involved in cell wall biosynthesis
VPDLAKVDIAVLIPCFNEAMTVGMVVGGFRRALPRARIYVYDNNSTDGTADAARAAGAIVRREERQGKGAVVRRMFADVDADVYVMVDGDNTYHAPSAPRLVQLLLSGPYDMVNGARVTDSHAAFRPGHTLGNAALTGLVGYVFGQRTTDMLSGYKVFSRRYAKVFPALSGGFEIETELTVHALEMAMPVAEMKTPYGARQAGSLSKLSTFRDGFRILKLIGQLVKEERPLQFFGAIAIVLAVLSLSAGTSVVLEYLQTGLVPRFPTAIFATGAMLAALLSLFAGLILDTVTRGRREMKRMQYLAYRAPGGTQG